MVNTNKERYREIITKAVCGGGSDHFKSKREIFPAFQPASILGCWIINHQYEAKKTAENKVEIYGTYDVNIWYSYDGNTKTEVAKEIIDYEEEINISSKDTHSLANNDEVIVTVLQQPNCLQCYTDGEAITVELEKEFEVKVIGDTRINVRID